MMSPSLSFMCVKDGSPFIKKEPVFKLFYELTHLSLHLKVSLYYNELIWKQIVDAKAAEAGTE